MAVAVAVGVGVAALATAAAAATSATAAASAVHQDAGEDVPPACAGGTTPGAKVCVTVDVHVEAVAGAGGAGLTRFVVEDALETAILPAIAAETGLEPSRDIKLVVDTPPEGQVGGVFYTIFLRVVPSVSDTAVTEVAAAAVRGFGEGLAAGVPAAGGVMVLRLAVVVGTRVAPVEEEGGEEDAAGASPSPEATAGGDNDDGGDDEAVTGTSAGDGNDDGEGGSSGLSAGAVAGIVVGVMALAVLVVAVVVTLWRRRTHL